MNARREYLENAVRGASALGLVVMLYEQLVEDLRRATIAIDANQIDQRTNAVNHAFLILGQLQGRLDHDGGGEVARKLDRFYDVVREKLFQAHVAQSKPMLGEIIAALLEVRGAWQQAEHAQQGTETHPPERVTENEPPAEMQRAHVDWNA